MFGQNTVASSWGNNQQNQPQQGTTGFGQPSGFGATNAFGSTSTFGQPQAQPANPIFGGTTNNSGTSGFGAFGGANTAQSNAFGAKPAGFGTFGGGTTGFGGTSNAFGSTPAAAGATTGANIFGQPSTSGTSAFGSNAFGAKPFTTSSSQGENTGPVSTGSANPPYSVFNEKDAQTPSLMIQYQAISCMPAYRGTSFEELRFQDYTQGRKNSTSGGSTFGQTTTPTFGSTTTGAATTFGQPQTNAAAPAFGSTATNTTAPTGGFGAFGQTNTQPATTGFGAFGQTQPQAPTQTQPAQNTGFGTFGQQGTQPSTGTNLFGSSAFGQAQNKPAGFGAFGGSNTTGTSTFGGGAFGSGTGTFGSTQQQPQQQTTFGQSTTQPASTGFGAFGSAANNTNKPLFGQPAQAAQPTTTGFGAFGQPAQQTQQQQQQQPAGFSSNLFGGNTTGTNLFGQSAQQPANQQQTTGFGTNTQPSSGFGGNLFGGNTQQQQQQQQQQAGFGAFGKPAAPAGQATAFGGFGQPATNNAQSNLFGVTQNNQGPTGFGTQFGAKPAPALGATQSTGLGNMFGSNSNQAATAPNQGALTASINQPIGANLPIFAMLPPGPRAVTLDQSQAKKKAPFFVDVPTRSPVPRVQLGGFTPANSKLRGFGSSTSSSILLSSSGLSFSSGKPNALSLSRQQDSLTPDALINGRASPSLGTGERRSVKKLILDKKVEATDLFSRSGSASPGLRSRVSFSPALSVAARETAAHSSPVVESPTPASRAQRTSNRFTAAPSTVLDGEVQSDGSGLKEGDYWSKPDLQSLMAAGHAELRCCKNLVVGRIGYGEVHFLEPVDLTGLSKLSQLYGDVIRFDDKECSVYPDIDDSEKPPAGSYLNVPARMILLRCWANDKATREPIKSESHPLMAKHLKKLKNMRDTKFESFEAGEGKWTFTVEHF